MQPAICSAFCSCKVIIYFLCCGPSLNVTFLYLCSNLARTSTLMAEFGRFYEQQYAVALFNSVRYEIEGGGNTQTQLLHRKVNPPYIFSFCPVLQISEGWGKIVKVWKNNGKEDYCPLLVQMRSEVSLPASVFPSTTLALLYCFHHFEGSVVVLIGMKSAKRKWSRFHTS